MDKEIEACLTNVNDQLPKIYAHIPGIQVVRTTDWLGMVSSHLGVSSNAVYAARFSEDNVREKVRGVLSFYSSKNCLPMRWFLTPTCQPNILSKILEEEGLRHVTKVPGMFLHLENFTGAVNPDSPLRISQVTNIEQLGQWLIPVKEEFDKVESQAFFDVFKKKGFDAGVPWKLFVGTVEGKPVSASRLFCTESTAGIYSVVTIPAQRGKGYGTEITIAPLKTAKKLGYKIATLTSSASGYNVYQRLGFQQCCFVDVYVSTDKIG